MAPNSESGDVFPLPEVRERRVRSGEQYLEFLRIPEMSVGFYAQPAGGTDTQTPHREDEIYYVVRGRSMISIAGRDRLVETGATIFVARGVEHRFHTITEPLELLVVFAPAETADPPAPPPAAPSGRDPPTKVS